MKRRELEAILLANGCKKIRDRGKHAVWKAPNGALVSVPRHTELKRFTVRSILRAAGIELD